MSERQIIQHYRTDISGNTPSAEVLEHGEIAINYFEGEESLYIKNNNNKIVEFKDKNYIDSWVEKLQTNTELKFYCIEPVTVTINGEDKIFTANTYVDIFLKDTDDFSITTTSDNSILTLNAWPGALDTFYTWLNGVSVFDGILFDMNDLSMYEKWNQGNQGAYRVQYAQYKNCIFWSDNAYISAVAERPNYTLYYSTELPLCYSTIPENTFKSFYFAYSVAVDPNWSNPVYRESFAAATWATQVFSYYGAKTIGIFDMDSSEWNITLPKDCRGLMFYSPNIENAGVFDAVNTTTFGAKSGSWRDAFAYCYNLKNLYIKNLKVSLNVSWSPINQQSIEFIVTEATNTSNITISLSPYTYYRLSDSIKTAAAEKNITLALISTNYLEDDTRWNTIPKNISDLTNDSGFINQSQAQEIVNTSTQNLSGSVINLQEQINNINPSNVQGFLQLRAYLFNVSGTYTTSELEELLSVSLTNLIESMSNGVPITIFSKDSVSANISFVTESNYTLTNDGILNTLTLYWHQYQLWNTLTVTLSGTDTYTITNTQE